MKFMKKSSQKGVALFMVLSILSLMTMAFIALVGILLIQTKAMGFFSDSVIAFYAADTGIEKVLFDVYQADYEPLNLGECKYPWQDYSAAVPNVEYQVCVSDSSLSSIWSTGRYEPTNTKRRIEITFQ